MRNVAAVLPEIASAVLMRPALARGGVRAVAAGPPHRAGAQHTLGDPGGVPGYDSADGGMCARSPQGVHEAACA